MKQFSCTESYLRGFNLISCKWYGTSWALPLYLYVPRMLQRKMLMAMHIRRPFSLPAWLGFHFMILSIRPHLLISILSQWCHQIINLSAYWSTDEVRALVVQSPPNVPSADTEVFIIGLWRMFPIQSSALPLEFCHVGWQLVAWLCAILQDVSFQSPDNLLLSFHD